MEPAAGTAASPLMGAVGRSGRLLRGVAHTSVFLREQEGGWPSSGGKGPQEKDASPSLSLLCPDNESNDLVGVSLQSARLNPLKCLQKVSGPPGAASAPWLLQSVWLCSGKKPREV